MVTINLSNSEKVEQLKSEKKTFSTRIMLSVFLLVLATGLYGGLVVWLKVLNSKIQSIEAETNSITGEMTGDNVDKILDIAKRIDVISKHSKASYDPMEDIERMEKSMLPEIYLDSMAYSESSKALLLTLVANDFSEIVRQIVALKKISGYADVVATGSIRDKNTVKTDIVVTGLFKE